MSIVPGRDVPEVPQAWVDAVNEAINDANHEDLCSSLHALADCDSYKPGQWDIGVDLTIAVGVLDPLIRRRIGGEFTQAAEVLASAIRDLNAHIEARAQEIAAPLVTAAQQRAAERVAELERDLAFEKQRHADLERELRRQLDAQVKANERLHREVKETRAAVCRVEALKVWTNEDRRRFVFADELWEALAECGSPAARAYNALKAAGNGEVGPS